MGCMIVILLFGMSYIQVIGGSATLALDVNQRRLAQLQRDSQTLGY